MPDYIVSKTVTVQHPFLLHKVIRSTGSMLFAYD